MLLGTLLCKSFGREENLYQLSVRPGEEWLPGRHMFSLGIYYQCSKVVFPAETPPCSVLSLAYFPIFDLGYSDRRVVYTFEILICLSLMKNDIELFFNVYGLYGISGMCMHELFIYVKFLFKYFDYFKGNEMNCLFLIDLK